jgi:hypothetical protein
MIVVYLAGPYTGPTHDHRSYLAIERHIMQAREAAAWCVQQGYGFFCPHLHSAHFECITPDAPPEYWYALDLRFLPVCDAVLLLPGWEQSQGALREKAEAERLGLPVFTDRTCLRQAVLPLAWTEATP